MNGYRKGAQQFSETITSADASGGVEVVAAVAGKQLHVLDVVIASEVSLTISLDDGADNTLLENLYMPATSAFAKTFVVPLIAATGQNLKVVTSGAGNVSVTITGYIY